MTRAEAYVALGSNLGDPEANLRGALARIARVATVEDVSSAHRTEPVGLREQPWFLNAVARIRTDLAPRELLAALKRIEEEMGRRRDVLQGPRTIDLDLLLYDDLEVDEPGLRIPHPRMQERRFVLAPLAEIAPGVRLRAGGPSASEALAMLPQAESVERLSLQGWPPALEG